MVARGDVVGDLRQNLFLLAVELHGAFVEGRQATNHSP
jgi:hypothetical protein